MHDVVAVALILLLAIAGYGAGGFHGQFGYRVGFRYGYRQGYFDGDRASWNRRRRDLQAAVASVLRADRPELGAGTTYTAASFAPLKPRKSAPRRWVETEIRQQPTTVDSR